MWPTADSFYAGISVSFSILTDPMKTVYVAEKRYASLDLIPEFSDARQWLQRKFELRRDQVVSTIYHASNRNLDTLVTVEDDEAWLITFELAIEDGIKMIYFAFELE